MIELEKFIENAELHRRDKNYSRRDEHKFQRYYLFRYLRNRNFSYQKIGKMFGLDHATVIHGLKQYEILKNYTDFMFLTTEASRLFPLNGELVTKSSLFVECLVLLENTLNETK